MNVIELKTTNYSEVIEQMNNLVEGINRHLRNQKGLMIQELAVDFVCDYKDNTCYFLQIKFINTTRLEG